MGRYSLLPVGLAAALLSGCNMASLSVRSGGPSGSGAVPSASGDLEQAQRELAGGEVGDSIRLYQVALGKAPAGSSERSDALYGIALARLTATAPVRNLDLARLNLQTLLRESPSYARRTEALALLSLIDDLRRERFETASAKRALGARESELAATREELGTKEAQLRSKERALTNLRKALR